jgi:hypothetical protein
VEEEAAAAAEAEGADHVATKTLRKDFHARLQQLGDRTQQIPLLRITINEWYSLYSLHVYH